MSQPADHDQRQQALDISNSFIVQAPAGSGKTELLIRRFLKLLAAVDKPEQILAITFTRKAATEMRHRVIEQLQRAQQAEPEDEFAAQGWRLARAALARNNQLEWGVLEQPSRLRIQTIDAFSRGLAQALPLLAGSGVQLAPSTDPGSLYQEAARELLGGFDSDSPCAPELRLLLAHLDNRRGQLENLLIEMLQRRDQWLKLLPESAHFEVFCQQMESLLTGLAEQTLQAWLATQSKGWLAELADLVDYARQNLLVEADTQADPRKAGKAAEKAAGLERPGSVQPASAQMLIYWKAVSKLLLTDSGVRKKVDKGTGFPPGKGIAAERKQQMMALLEQLSAEAEGHLRRVQLQPHPTLGEDAELIGATAKVLRYAAAELQLTFQRRGEGDFAELALRALQALSDDQGPTDLALALDYRLQHILVDEFQDTSWLQYRLVELLTAGWQIDDGRSLFLVGDPMQSIYRFRQADVGLFLRAREFPLGELTLMPLTLSANFRSDAGLVAANNQLFEQLFPARQEISSGAVCFAPSTSTRAGDGASMLYCHGFTGDSVRSQEAIALLAALQTGAADVECSQGAPGSVDAILVRSRSHLVEILPLLRAAEVPFQAVELQSLASSSALLDLLAITRALLRPADRVAWLALLHGPCVGVQLTDLTRLTAAAPPTRPLIDLLTDSGRLSTLSANGQQRLSGFLERYVRVTDAAGESLPRQVERLWLALGGPALLADEAGLNDADHYLQILDAATQGHNPLTIERLHQLVDREFAHAGSHDGARLQVMTMHKSKGLQFDRVFIPGLDRQGRADATPLLAWEEHSTAVSEGDLLLAPIRSAYDDHHPIYQFIRANDQQRDQHEQLRLLYVALTRARYQVHVFAGLKTDAEGQIGTPTRSSLLARLWPALERQFVESVKSESPDNPDSAESSDPLAPPESIIINPSKSDWRRLVDLDALPDQPEPVAMANQVLAADPEQAIEFDWAGDSARIIGLLAHRHLCRLAALNESHWTVYLQRQKALLANQLQQYGMTEFDLPAGVAAVLQTLESTLEDPRGRWVLAGGQQARSEYALSCVSEGRIVRLVIDRTFIDTDGQRWVIDYKTGFRSGGNIDGFLDQEQQRYASQLEQYAALFRELGEERIRMALYFPRLSGWREWAA